MSPSHWYWLFRIVFVSYIVYASVRTALANSTALHGPQPGMATFIFFLAMTEIVAALALLWRGSQTPAGIVLCIIFAVVAVLETASGVFPARFIYYASSVAVILGLDRIVRECS